MRRLHIKFPNQIRISGWDFGSSARAMNQAGGIFSTQAELVKVTNSTTERKSMSTKTIMKRIALVTVSALGFGLLTTATPASASVAVWSPVSATLDTATTTLAGRVGQQVSITPTATWSASTGSTDVASVLSFAASLTGQPSTSAIYPTITSVITVGSLGFFQGGTGLTIGGTAISSAIGAAGTSSTVSTINYYGVEDAGHTAGATASVGTVTFTPTVAGTYTLVVWNETRALTSTTAGAQAALSGTESSQTFTINVSTGVSTITMSTIGGSTSSTGGSHGALIKLLLKDSAGNAATLAPGESVTITPSGSAYVNKVNGGSATGAAAGSTYSLAASDFNASGIAFINVKDATAESPTISASISGGASASTSLTFKSTVSVATAPYNSSLATGVSSTSGGTGVKIPVGATTISWRQAASTGSYVAFTVTESLTNNSLGSITGYTVALSYDAAVGGSTTLGYASHSVTATTSATALQSYTLATDGTTTPTTVTSLTNQAGALTVSPTTVNAVAGSTNTLTATLKDVFKRAYASQTVTISVAGKNATTSSVTAVTDANGNATFSLTDANTNTAVTDTVTFSSGSSASVSISYGANAASTVTLTTDDTTAGVANDTVSPKAIDTSYAGATGGARTVTATVKNAAGALLAGVPVTFTVSGTGAAVTSTTATVYTGVSGTASASVYGWITGTYTVTAKAGTASGTGTETFYSTGNDSVRTVSASAVGNQVTGLAKDRYGNPVQGATLYAKITSGSGNIGGAITATGTTDSKGEVVWVVSDANSTVTVSNISFSSPAGTVVGQTGAAKGYDIGGADATAITAYVAGTTTTAEKGVGSTYDAAGVSSATADATVTANSDAIDAANEATDAANAATDAANAAAEAADAATAAAQDAQAAVAELATQVAALIAGIKAQITTLTNLVIKIQKKVKA